MKNMSPQLLLVQVSCWKDGSKRTLSKLPTVFNKRTFIYLKHRQKHKPMDSHRLFSRQSWIGFTQDSYEPLSPIPQRLPWQRDHTSHPPEDPQVSRPTLLIRWGVNKESISEMDWWDEVRLDDSLRGPPPSPNTLRDEGSLPQQSPLLLLGASGHLTAPVFRVFWSVKGHRRDNGQHTAVMLAWWGKRLKSASATSFQGGSTCRRRQPA